MHHSQNLKSSKNDTKSFAFHIFVLNSSLYTMLKLSKANSPPKLFQYLATALGSPTVSDAESVQGYRYNIDIERSTSVRLVIYTYIVLSVY